jgi:hypothetical protein
MKPQVPGRLPPQGDPSNSSVLFEIQQMCMLAVMRTPTRGATRLARAAAFGVVTLALASGAHVAAGGALPSMMVLALLAVPLMMAALVLTSRRCGPVLLLGSLTAAQVLAHEVLMALTSHVPVAMFPAELGAHHGAQALVSGQMSAHSASALEGAAVGVAGGWSVTMQVAHVLATLVTALLLARGEQALWQLAARLLPALPGKPLMPGDAPLRAAVLVSVPALRPSVVSGGPGLRGPPVRFAAAA